MKRFSSPNERPTNSGDDAGFRLALPSGQQARADAVTVHETQDPPPEDWLRLRERLLSASFKNLTLNAPIEGAVVRGCG